MSTEQKLHEALSEIVGLIRNGGPDRNDVRGHAAVLDRATDIAHAALLAADSKAGGEPVAEIVAFRYGGGKPIASMTNCEIAGLPDEEIRAAAKEALFGQGIDCDH